MFYNTFNKKKEVLQLVEEQKGILTGDQNK